MNLSNEKKAIRGGTKLLDEFPVKPTNENDNANAVKKIQKEKATKMAMEACGASEVVGVPSAPASKTSRFTPIDDDRMDKVEDMGNLTAADLRKSQTGEFAEVFFLFLTTSHVQFQQAYARINARVPNGTSPHKSGLHINKLVHQSFPSLASI